MSTSLRVLVLHEDAAEAERYVETLAQAGFRPTWERVEHQGDLLDRLDIAPWDELRWDMILADICPAKPERFTTFRLVRDRWHDIPIICVGDSDEGQFVAECFRRGAADYLPKSRLGRLGEIVADTLERHRRRAAQRQPVRELQLLLHSVAAFVWTAAVEQRGNRFHWKYHPEEEMASEYFLLADRPAGSAYIETWNELKVPADRKRTKATAHEALKSGAPGYRQEFSCLDRRSSVHFIREQVRIEPLGEKRWRLFGVWTDISELKRAQTYDQDLREQMERLLLHVMSTVHCLIWHADVRCRKDGLRTWEVLSINDDAAQRFFPLPKHPPARYFDERWTAIHPEDRERVARNGQTYPCTETTRYHQEFRCRTLSGDYRWLRDDVVLEPIKKDRWRAVGVCTDITDIKEEEAKILDLNRQLELRVRERTAKLEEANRVLRDLAERSRELSRRLVEIQEQERRSLARELHDEVGQWLTGLKLAVEAVERQSPNGVRPLLTEARQSIQELMNRVQSISQSLRPPMLDMLGIIPTLRGHLERYTRQTGIQVTFSHVEPPRRYPSEIELAIFRFVQETLSNVARHAQTSQATVKITDRAGGVTVSVADKGVGFDTEAVLSGAARFGLLGMRERIGLIGGKMEIHSAPKKGSRLTVRIPVAEGGKQKAGGRRQDAESKMQ